MPQYQSLVMHPLIRLITVLIYAACLPGLAAPGLVTAAVPLLMYFLFTDGVARHELAHALRRIRWLLVSIAILYLWFTPGVPLFGEPHAWIPTREGLQEGMTRAGVLVLMVAAVTWLLHATQRVELVRALMTLLQPLQWLGLSVQRLACRVALTLEYLPRAQADVRVRRQAGGSPIAMFAAVFRDIETDAVMLRDEVSVTEVRNPPWAQWLIPLLTAGGMAVLYAAFGGRGG